MILRFDDGILRPWPAGEAPDTTRGIWETSEPSADGSVRVVWHERVFSKAPYAFSVWARAGAPYPAAAVIAAIEAHTEAALETLDRLARESVQCR